ncbi:UDPGT domain-containing protein [Cephalotus follicularis]|uniref:Glycosyltransferase n=1 Tax=Cephalotus follicularis TaxID=3775 RepID=A0A1Q3BE10_CEPFO|nr:UDPGT domain-containing protein [Cephalotus follicularis]
MPQFTTNEPHVAVLAFPFGTHAAPLITIIHRLAVASPNTHFSFLNTSQSNNSIFSSDVYNRQPNLKAHNVWDGVPEGYVFVGKPQESIELFVKAAPETFRKGVEAAVAETGRKVSCLVTDAFFWFAAEIAGELGVPWVPFWTAGPCSLSTHVYTDLIRKTIGVGGIEGREDESLEFIPGMSQVVIRDLQEGIVFGNLESVFSDMVHRMGIVLPQAAAIFINSFEELDLTITNDLKSKFKQFLSIGPLNLASPPPRVPDTNGCLPWLDQQKVASVAYISFGTVMAPSPPELVALAEALEASKIPFIWSLGEKLKVHLPKGFLDKTRTHGIVVPWAPQSDVLENGAVGVFITHCGWNSLLESIAGGVPMICRPFFGDQRLNGRMVQDVWEIGVTATGGPFTTEGVMGDLDLILSQARGKKMKDNISVLKTLAQTAVGPEGSSAKNYEALLNLVRLSI